MSVAPKSTGLRNFIILLVVCLAITLIYGFVIHLSISDDSERGQFGDAFGGLNALFSSFAFAGIVYAILIQREELSLQREELRMSREELAAQNQIISQQLASMQESFKFEQQKEFLAAEPKFVQRGGSGSAGKKEIKFVNKGATVTDVSIDFLGEYSFETIGHPVQIFDETHQGSIIGRNYEGRECPEMTFRISFTNRLGIADSQEFVVRAGEYKLHEI